MADISRRRLLSGIALSGAALGAGAIAREPSSSAGAATATESAPGASSPAAFHGPHQAGILPDPAAEHVFAVFDVVGTSREELMALFAMLTDQARVLTGTRPAVDLGPKAPPVDNGILGPSPRDAGALTVTVGVGASLFDERFGLVGRRPARLTPMTTFSGDNLDRTECDGDLIVHLAGPSRDVVLHGLRQIARNTRGSMQLRWKIDGFANPQRPSGTQRNLLGFKDGIANPAAVDDALMDHLVWVPGGGDEPDWTAGGTYQVVRIIRMLVEFWDRVSLNEQERMIGRRRDSGAPLDANHETDIPNYEADPKGQTIGLDAHIRMANPRTGESEPTQILRRGVNYDRGIDSNGNLDMGLVFNCYQQDIARQFEATQKRLDGEPLTDYISPTGGGYFFVLPGVVDADDTFASGLFRR